MISAKMGWICDHDGWAGGHGITNTHVLNCHQHGEQYVQELTSRLSHLRPNASCEPLKLMVNDIENAHEASHHWSEYQSYGCQLELLDCDHVDSLEYEDVGGFF